MTELRNRTGETVQVAVLDGREVVYVERLDSPNTLRLFLEVGRRNSAHSTGCGKALLAFCPHDQLERTLKGWQLTAKTPLHDHRCREAPHRARRGAPSWVRRQSTRVGGRCDLGGGADPRRVGASDRRDQCRRAGRAARTPRAGARAGHHGGRRNRVAASRLSRHGRSRLRCASSPAASPRCPIASASPSATAERSSCVLAPSSGRSGTVASTRNRRSPAAGYAMGCSRAPCTSGDTGSTTARTSDRRRSSRGSTVDVVDGDVFVLLPDEATSLSLRDQLLARARAYDRDEAWRSETDHAEG